jgi:HlyD family type I secretion membrane fusion protein
MAATILTLNDCTEYRETVAARPPRIAHLGVILCVTTLTVCLTWAALTPVDLVVRADGVVRPVDLPTQVFTAVGQKVEGRVVEVRVQEGSRVAKGDVLLRLDTRRLEHEITAIKAQLEGSQREEEQLGQLAELHESQFQVARSKAAAELAQASAEIARARQARDSGIRQAEIKLSLTKDKYARSQKLATSRAVSEQEVAEAQGNVLAAEEGLKAAQIPVEESRLDVLSQAIILVDRDHRLATAELESKRLRKQREIDAMTKELAELELQATLAVLRSPIDGVVTRGQYHVGDVVAMGSPVFDIAAPQSYCFEATVASRDMGLLHHQMAARVKIDAYDYQLYGSMPGDVCFIAPDAARTNDESADSQNTYKVRVTLSGERIGQGKFTGAVKLGMTGQVEIITDRRTVLTVLLRRIRSSISLG